MVCVFVPQTRYKTAHFIYLRQGGYAIIVVCLSVSNFVQKLLKLECGPMPNVMLPCRTKWRPLFNAAKFGWRSLLDCRAVTLPRRETGWNLLECPKLTKRSQPLVGRSSQYCEDMWGRYCCLTSFFLIVDTCLSCEDIARQSCAMVPRWRFLATSLGLAFAASRVQQISDEHSKFALRPHHMWKYGRHPMCGRWD